MYAQVDANGFAHTMLDHISDYVKDGRAGTKEAIYVVTKRGCRCQRKSSIGWKLQVHWKDEKTEWILLSIMKESHPVDTAEFAVSQGIQDEPACCWWVP